MRPVKNPLAFSRLGAHLDHPVWVRETRASSRLARTSWLFVAVTAIAAALAIAGSWSPHLPPVERGATIFQLLFGGAMLLTTLLGPALSANAIALERDGKTWEALVMADVTPRELDRGKFWASYTHLAQYLFAFVPAAAIPVALQGASLLQTFLGFVMLFGWGALTVRFGLAMSAGIKSSRLALLLTVAASAIGGATLSAASTAASHWLHRDLSMESLSSELPVFWPVALAHEAMTWINVRYLVIEVAVFAFTAWFFLRELTVFALTSAGLGRLKSRFGAMRMAYFGLAPLVALFLAFMPLSGREAIVSECFMAVYLFVGMSLFAGALASEHGKVSMGTWWGIAALGAALPAAIAICSNTGDDLVTGDRHELLTFIVHCATFTTFLAGCGALSARYFQRAWIPRAVLCAATIVGAVLPFLLEGLRRLGPTSEPHDPGLGLGALSPLAFLSAHSYQHPPLEAALPWAIVGIVALTFVTWNPSRKIRRT